MEEFKQLINIFLDRFDRLEASIDRLHEKTDANTVVLVQHEQRSTTAEENLKILRAEFDPVKKQSEFANTIFKVLVAAGAFLVFLNELGLLDFLKR